VLPAIVHFCHVAGIVLFVGGIMFLAGVVYPAAAKPGGAAFAEEARRAAALPIGLGALLALASGLFKWIPQLGGVGWTGLGGANTAILHSKLLLAVIVLGMSHWLLKRPAAEEQLGRRVNLARLAVLLALAVIALGVAHRYGLASA
jgi:uncharacterized membrane protein